VTSGERPVTFLSQQEVLRIHATLIDLYGGAHGVRDAELLASALAQPEATYEGLYLHSEVVEQAAAYGFHLAQNHPFLDGNKRIALAALLVFLEINGRSLRVEQESLYAVMMSVAEGRLSKPGLAGWIRDNLG
jgi:death-on-curing protein